MNEQFSNLQDFQNIFTRDQYPPGENNTSQVPFDDIFTQLNTMFPEGYSYEVTQAGSLANGHNFVVLKLTIPMESGPVTRPGAADGTIGLSGLIAVALRNAVLRHLGMGSGLYQYEEGQEPNFNNGGGHSASPQPSNNAGGQGRVYGNVNYDNTRPNTNNNGRNYRPWDGTVIIKSGRYQGQPWSNIDQNDLQGMVNNGNPLAIKEMQRRQGEGRFPASPFAR